MQEFLRTGIPVFTPESSGIRRIPPDSCSRGGASSVIYLSSPANADIDEDAGAAAAYRTMAKNPLVAMEADNHADIDEDAGGAAAAYGLLL